MNVEVGRGRKPTKITLVPHTHWDREWYLPFQRFRLRLVELVDALLDVLAANPDLCFTLDGQTVVVDDYLDLRPDAEPALRALIETGRIATGPWKTLPDEFLVSGETLIRNLSAGVRRGNALGGGMKTGYLPDMFGHIAQMPQILARAGIDRAVVWRGVPAVVTSNRFSWRAPDGSEVDTEYLPFGYGNAAFLFAVPGDIEMKVEAFVERMRPFCDDRTILAMNGTDHMRPIPDLVAMVTSFNDSQDRYRIEVKTLESYMDDEPAADRSLVYVGELRSGARANVLMGVTSARIDAKAACASAERMLERYAEPLAALFDSAIAPVALDLAWHRMILNSAHDSICGCSVDEVADEVLVRYGEARQIAEEITERAVAAAAAETTRGRFIAVNPTPFERTEIIEIDAAVAPDIEDVAIASASGVSGVQEVGRQQPLLYERRVSGRDAGAVLRLMHGRELLGRWFNHYETTDSPGGPRLTIEVDSEADPPSLDVDAAQVAIKTALESRPDDMWTVRVISRARRRLVAPVSVPALGWSEFEVIALRGAIDHPVEASERTLWNGIARVDIEVDGTLEMESRGGRVSGALRLVEGGDAGDSYNYAPPASDRIVDRPGDVDVRVVEAGPVRAILEVARTYRWPIGLAGDGRSSEEHAVTVLTEVEMRVGEPFVRVRLAFDNPCTDHRVRLHVPLAHAVASSAAEGGFAVVERPLIREGGHGEVPIATYPAQSFVAVDGLSVLLPHTVEYEIVEGRELAVTVLRSIGLISRNDNAYRAEPAGPEVAIPKAQLRGAVEFCCALYPHRGSWEQADSLSAAERYRHPFAVGLGTAERAPRALRSVEGLRVEGEGVVMTSLRRTAEGLLLRLVRYGESPTLATVSGPFSTAVVTDLLGNPRQPVAPASPGVAQIALEPWAICTLLLTE